MRIMSNMAVSVVIQIEASFKNRTSKMVIFKLQWRSRIVGWPTINHFIYWREPPPLHKHSMTQIPFILHFHLSLKLNSQWEKWNFPQSQIWTRTQFQKWTCLIQTLARKRLFHSLAYLLQLIQLTTFSCSLEVLEPASMVLHFLFSSFCLAVWSTLWDICL